GVNLEQSYAVEGRNIATELEKSIVLGMIDNEWKEHLREMDDLRSAVHNAQYEQKDPLLVYKLESFELFKSMLNRLNQESVELLMKLDIPFEQEIQSSARELPTEDHYAKAQTNAPAPSSSSSGSGSQFQGSQGYAE